MGKGQVWSRRPRDGSQGAGAQVELGGSILWDSRAGQEGPGGWSRGGPTPGGKERLLLKGGWGGSWSESESESQE